LNLSEGAHGGFLAPAVQSEFDGRLVAIPADGDIALLYLRTDLMEDITTRSDFRQKYKRELNPPETWEEYLDLLTFFHNPEKEFYGSCEQRNPANGWMFWMPRYASQAQPHKYLFDDEMRPLINSQEGVRATESYVAAVEYSAPDILSEKSDYPYTVSTFRSGKAFSIIQTLALAKIANAESSPVRGKVKAVPMPGTMVNGKLIRRTSFIYGNNLVVSTGSKNPELAFLFAMWFTDPEISSLSIRMTTGLMDPYRGSHIEDPAVWEIYTKEAVSQLAAHSKIAVPEGTGLPGDSEYMKALSTNLWLTAKKEITPKEAMAKTSAEWERITERYGRHKQKAYWKNFKTHYPK
jgi:multiple sugar transport system substrate-binding protein